jgi:hypothetical protein
MPMRRGADAGIIIERAQGQIVQRRILLRARDQRRAAVATERAMRPWGGLVVGYPFLPLKPVEVLGPYECPGPKSGTVGFAAHRAVTVRGHEQIAAYSILDMSAQTAAGKYSTHSDS